MAKFTIEVDTDDLNSVLSTYLMLGKLISFWKKSLKDNIKEEDDNDPKPI